MLGGSVATFSLVGQYGVPISRYVCRFFFNFFFPLSLSSCPVLSCALAAAGIDVIHMSHFYCRLCCDSLLDLWGLIVPLEKIPPPWEEGKGSEKKGLKIRACLEADKRDGNRS